MRLYTLNNFIALCRCGHNYNSWLAYGDT